MKNAFKVQLRVIGALIIRETRVRYGQSNLGYLWAILEPVAFVAAIAGLMSVTGSHAPFGKSKALFIALGILPFFLYRNISNQVSAAFDANQALLNFPIVKEIDTVIARAILEIATSVVLMVMIVTAIIFIADTPAPHNFPKLAYSCVSISLFAFGIGLINAVVATKINSWMNVFKLLSTPIFWISGVFYSFETLPTNFRHIVSWNPIIHGVEGFRDGYYLNYRHASIDISYLFWIGVVLTLIGLSGERAIRMRQS